MHKIARVKRRKHQFELRVVVVFEDNDVSALAHCGRDEAADQEAADDQIALFEVHIGTRKGVVLEADANAHGAKRAGDDGCELDPRAARGNE